MRLTKKYLFPLLVFTALCILCAVLFTGCGKSGGSISDEAAFRSRPKAGGSIYVDQSVISRGNGAWQGQQYINAARTAFGFVNQLRTNSGYPELRWDDELAACAMVRSTELPAAFSHTRPDGSDWYTVCPDLMYGENLAQGYDSPEEAVDAWMNSPKHKDNILTPDYTTGGIGVYEHNGMWFWTQLFGFR